MKCEEREDALEMCKADSKKSKLTQMSRFCPKPNIRCQAECYPKQERNHKATFVHGMPKAFQAHDISPEYLLNSSWNHYIVHGTERSTITGKTIDEGQIAEKDDMLYLPVAMSKVKTIQDIDRRTKFSNKLPWSSGGFKSEDTKIFLKSINIHIPQERELARGSMPRVSITTPFT